MSLAPYQKKKLQILVKFCFLFLSIDIPPSIKHLLSTLYIPCVATNRAINKVNKCPCPQGAYAPAELFGAALGSQETQ